jgi:DNA-binding transcriptional MerR regulator
MGGPGRKPGTRESAVDLMTIGEFAREARLSQKALRHYDELGLLAPARVDPDSGYRFYRPDQLEQARLVATLRQIGVSLAEIKVIMGLPPEAAADRIAGYWTGVERDHDARRALADHLVNRLRGKRSVMYDVATRVIPHRSLLCLKRHVDGWDGAWAFGKEFVGIFKERPLPRMEGVAGGFFCIYHGEVSEDSDGPLEWCRPVPEDEAEQIASQYPEFELRTEPAHEEAVVHLGFYGETSAAQWQLISETLRTWAVEQNREPSELGVRVVYKVPDSESVAKGPDCDFAVPIR